MVYRIVTEDKGEHWQQAIEILVAKSFDGFSISKQTGYYKGQKEKSIVIEIDTLDDNSIYQDIKIKSLAKNIKEVLNQECVLLQCIASDSELI